MQPLRIAVTGTPGSGKTSFCDYVDFDTVRVLDLAEKYNAARRDNLNPEIMEIDVDLLKKSLFEEWGLPPKKVLFVDGHLSHNLPVDCIILMRCRPDVLEVRLKDRKWNEEKISENVEFELLSAIIDEMDQEIPTLEVDATFSTVPELWDRVNNWLTGEKKTQMLEIDWIGELH